MNAQTAETLEKAVIKITNAHQIIKLGHTKGHSINSYRIDTFRCCLNVSRELEGLHIGR